MSGQDEDSEFTADELAGHTSSDPVIFNYASSVNATFQGEEESGYTWGEWREMSMKAREEAREEFVHDTLGVEVWES